MSAGIDWSTLEVPEPSALLVVDLQLGFITDATEHVPRRIDELLAARRDAFSLILATRFWNRPESNFRNLIRWNRLASEPDTLLHPVLDGIECIVEKDTYSATAEIIPILRSRQIGTVLICGIDTDVCVLQHAAGLFDAGLTPVVVADACGSTAGEHLHQAALQILRRTVGNDQVVSLAGPP